MKTYYCEFCKAEIAAPGKCPVCGNFVIRGAATFVYGRTSKDAYTCELGLTDTYLIVKKRSKSSMIAQTTAAGFGGIVGEAIYISAQSKLAKDRGYYPITNIKQVIYPYKNKKYKGVLAAKIINKDDTDFILVMNLNGVLSEKSAKLFFGKFSTVGVPVIDGSHVNYGDVFCSHPFVNEDTFGVYRDIGATAPVTVPPTNTVSVPVQPVVNAAVPVVSPAPPTNPVAPRFCAQCGSPLSPNDRFCGRCGSPIAGR